MRAISRRLAQIRWPKAVGDSISTILLCRRNSFTVRGTIEGNFNIVEDWILDMEYDVVINYEKDTKGTFPY